MRRQTFAFALALAVSWSAAAAVRAADWRPVDPADLARTSSTVEPGADAEVLFWDVRVEDLVDASGTRSRLDHYLRVKILSERGRESQGVVSIAFDKGTRIMDIEGRTIRRDGSIVPLGRDAVFERTTLKTTGVKRREKSFSMPAVEPGAIIEYRYREVRGGLANYLPLQFQRDIPVKSVTYHVKPIGVFGYTMRSQTFHGVAPPFQREDDRFFATTVKDLPAAKVEPHMPPEDETRMWMLIYYTEDKKLEPASFWKDRGRAVYEAYRTTLRPTAKLKAAAAEAIGDATTDDAKLARLFAWVRGKVRNSSDDHAGFTDADREKLKENKSPTETLERGVGTGYDINVLFGALAASAGYDARIAQLANRGEHFFTPNFPDGYFLTTYDIAVRAGGTWRFYDPGTPDLPSDRLRWQEEGQQALVSDAKDPVFVVTPMTPAERSMVLRTALFKLEPDGTLEGDMRMEMTGHRASEERWRQAEMSEAQREDALRDWVRARVGTAELSDIRVDAVTDYTKPIAFRCHVRAPGYAQRIGRRLLVQPSFFEKGLAGTFSASERAHPIYFHYPWAQRDSVRIAIPDGFTIDAVESPSPMKIEGVSTYGANVSLSPDGSMLSYTREFTFGLDGSIVFPRDAYAGLKKYFDMVQERDAHTLTAQQMDSAAK